MFKKRKFYKQYKIKIIQKMEKLNAPITYKSALQWAKKSNKYRTKRKAMHFLSGYLDALLQMQEREKERANEE